MSNPNNPFGIPNEMFDAIIASAIMGSVAPGMKKPNPDAGAKKPSHQEGAKAAKKISDSYVEAGFTDTQAFELLKTVLTTKRTLF